MNAKRVSSSGRLVRVDQRRRGRKWRIILGATATAAVILLIILAIRYKTRRAHRGKELPPTAATAETAAPRTAATAAPPTAAAGEVRAYVVNATKVPQRYGNALAALQDFNAAHGNVYRLEPYRPKVAGGEKSTVYFRPGFEAQAGELAAALRADMPRTRVDITIICGQDVSKLILEALAKKVPAPENVNVEVLNGGGIEGAASKIKDQLEANGYHVVVVGNAPAFDYKKTVLAAPEAQKETALKIASLFGLDESRCEPPGYDLKVIVGDDYTAAPETP